MKQLQTKKIWYNFDLNQPDPLDPRFRIATIADLPPIEKRYAGLVFFVINENVPYIFLNDLTTPKNLFGLINSSNLFGVTSVDYTTLITTLNSTNPILGSLVTVFPLGVTFIFNGTAWEYHSGDFIVDNVNQYTSIPDELLKTGKLVLVGVNKMRYIISEDNYALVNEVTELETIPTEFENNRYYKIDSILYFAINGVFYKIGEQTKLIQNQTLIKGSTIIEHNLNSTYICVLFWINDTTTVLRLTEYDFINENQIQIKSSTNVTGTMILSTIY